MNRAVRDFLRLLLMLACSAIAVTMAIAAPTVGQRVVWIALVWMSGGAVRQVADIVSARFGKGG